MNNNRYGSQRLKSRLRLDNNNLTCIDTYKIYDSCRGKDCIENARILFTDIGQETLNQCGNVRAKSAKLLTTSITNNELPFNKGYYQIDIRFYFLVVLECCKGFGNSNEFQGLCTFDKTVILYGGEGNAQTFKSPLDAGSCSSHFINRGSFGVSVPRTVVEAVDPVILRLNVTEGDNCRGGGIYEPNIVPDTIADYFNGTFLPYDGGKEAFISLGLFSMVRIERPSQLIIPACDFCVPEKECTPISNCSDPCDLFRNMPFPVDDFYPPEGSSEDLEDRKSDCGCGCSGNDNDCGCNQ